MHFKRADVDATIHDAIEAWSTLIVQGRRGKIRITGINRRTTRQKRVSDCRASVVLQRTQHRISINLVAGSGHITAAIVTAKIVAEGGHCATVVKKVSR